MDTLGETVFHEGCACGPIASAICNVVLHAGLHVDFELDWSHRGSKSGIIWSGIFVVVIIFWVATLRQYLTTMQGPCLLDMLLRSIHAKSLRSDLEFGSGVAKAKE